MKIKKIASLIKSDEHLYIAVKNNTQWIGSSKGLYSLNGLPSFSVEQLPKLLEIPERKMADIMITDFSALALDPFSELLEFNQETDVEILAAKTKVYIAGEVCHVFYGSTGAMLIPQKYLAPVFDSIDTQIYVERYDKNSESSVLAVFAGLQLVAIIPPLKVSKALLDEQKELIAYLDMSYNNNSKSIISTEAEELLQEGL